MTMCDACDARVKHGVSALEALANGEEVPDNVVTQAVRQHRPTFELPFPVIAFETESGSVGILTDQEGWTFFKGVLETLGQELGGN